jgi:hypothetical protein
MIGTDPQTVDCLMCYCGTLAVCSHHDLASPRAGGHIGQEDLGIVDVGDLELRITEHTASRRDLKDMVGGLWRHDDAPGWGIASKRDACFRRAAIDQSAMDEAMGARMARLW